MSQLMTRKKQNYKVFLVSQNLFNFVLGCDEVTIGEQNQKGRKKQTLFKTEKLIDQK